MQENESIQSLSFRIKRLFNEYRQELGKSLSEVDKVKYFVESLFPGYKEQLNNQYQRAPQVYDDDVKYADVLATALKLEHNAQVYETETLGMKSDVAKVRINAIHKPVKPAPAAQNLTKDKKTNENEDTNIVVELKQQALVFGKQALELGKQNTKDIEKIEKDQAIIKDQMTALTNECSSEHDRTSENIKRQC